MPERVQRAATSGDVAVFFLIAGMSPPNHSSVAGFTFDGRSSVTRDEAVNILNAESKPIFCSASLVGRSMQIATQPVISPDALLARQRYLQLASQDLVGLVGQASKESEVLLKSEYEAMVVSTGLLRRFYEEYDIPHSSSQAETDSEASGLFTAVVRVAGGGSVELHLDDGSTVDEGN